MHVKQGFTQSYSSQVNDEYGSAHSRAANLVTSKVLSELKTIQAKKEESNTLPDTGRRRQTLNTKDHFWLVTGKNKTAVDNWFRDLANCGKPLSGLAKKVPIFNKREEVLLTLSENQVPIMRAVWFIKMTAAYASAMSEANKTKKRQAPDSSLEWTQIVVRFLKDQLLEINSTLNSSASSSSAAGLGSNSTILIFF